MLSKTSLGRNENFVQNLLRIQGDNLVPSSYITQLYKLVAS